MKSSETHNAQPAVDPQLEQQYIEAHDVPSKEAWPYDEPFPLDVELAKLYKANTAYESHHINP